MRATFWIIIAIFSVLITSSSFTCITPSTRVAIDSLHYFEPRQIKIAPDDIKDTAITLKLHDGAHTFSKDPLRNYQLFKTDKDVKNDYYIMGIEPLSFDNNSLWVRIKYQAFDKAKHTNTSRIFKLNKVAIPLNTIKSFLVATKEYNNVFNK